MQHIWKTSSSDNILTLWSKKDWGVVCFHNRCGQLTWLSYTQVFNWTEIRALIRSNNQHWVQANYPKLIFLPQIVERLVQAWRFSLRWWVLALCCHPSQSSYSQSIKYLLDRRMLSTSPPASRLLEKRKITIIGSRVQNMCQIQQVKFTVEFLITHYWPFLIHRQVYIWIPLA